MLEEIRSGRIMGLIFSNVVQRANTAITSSGVGAGDTYSRIFVMNADGTGLTALTPSSSCGDVSPVLSPDGTKIAFKRNLRCSDFTAAIWVMNADGTNPKVMAYSAAAEWLHGPRWSPDSKAVVWRYSDNRAYGGARFRVITIRICRENSRHGRQRVKRSTRGPIKRKVRHLVAQPQCHANPSLAR